jgi:GNAT superfamily N-acetyltransferase
MTPTGFRTEQAAMAAWAAEFGCAPQILGVALTTVIGHGAAFAGRRVAFALAPTTTSGCVVTVPADWCDAARAALVPLPPSQAFEARRLAGVFGRAAERVVGPAWQGHLDADSFVPVDQRGTRPLLAADRTDLAALAAACDAGEWEASTVDLDRPPVFGCMADDRLVAAGTLTPWRDRFWHVGIVTHPGYRGRGYGRAVVSAMTRYALGRGWLLHYQTLLANAPSVAIARSLGYRQHAQTLAIRLTPA